MIRKKAPVKPAAKTAAKTAKTGDDTPVEGLILLAGLQQQLCFSCGEAEEGIFKQQKEYFMREDIS